MSQKYVIWILLPLHRMGAFDKFIYALDHLSWVCKLPSGQSEGSNAWNKFATLLSSYRSSWKTPFFQKHTYGFCSFTRLPWPIPAEKRLVWNCHSHQTRILGNQYHSSPPCTSFAPVSSLPEWWIACWRPSVTLAESRRALCKKSMGKSAACLHYDSFTHNLEQINSLHHKRGGNTQV